MATISQDGAIVAFEGGVLLVQLPSQPPAGATQDVSVTYSDPMMPPDTIRIKY